MTNEERYNRIRELLNGISLRSQVEILANVITFMGASHLAGAPEHITHKNIATVVLRDRESNGETVANALALQGLTMLAWLEDKQ